MTVSPSSPSEISSDDQCSGGHGRELGTGRDIGCGMGGGSDGGSDGGRGGGRDGGRGRGRGYGRRGGSHVATDGATEEKGWSSVSDVQVQPFSGNAGPTFPLEEDPAAIFLALFTLQLLEHIVVETNRYATLCLTSTHKGEGPPSTWETDAEEICAYLGFAILMGINKLPDLYDYWSTNELYHYFPIASRITRKRFLELSRFLHFADNGIIPSRGEPGYDRLAKVRPVIEMVHQSFLSSYNPHCENSIDEAMIKFKGRSMLSNTCQKSPSNVASRCGSEPIAIMASSQIWMCTLEGTTQQRQT